MWARLGGAFALILISSSCTNPAPVGEKPHPLDEALPACKGTAQNNCIIYRDDFNYSEKDRSPYWLWRIDGDPTNLVVTYGKSEGDKTFLEYRLKKLDAASLKTCDSSDPTSAADCGKDPDDPSNLVQYICNAQSKCVPHADLDFWNSPCCINTSQDKNDPNISRLASAVCNNQLLQDDRCQLEYDTALGFLEDPLFSDLFNKDLLYNNPYSVGTEIALEVQAINKQDGSLGWGFWNSVADPVPDGFAWFMQQYGDANDPDNGFYAMIKVPGDEFTNLRKIKLPDPDENWHTYRIAWADKCIEFFVDGKLVVSEHERLLRRADKVPVSLKMDYWLDNVNFDNPGAPRNGKGSSAEQGMTYRVIRNDRVLRINHMQIKKIDAANYPCSASTI